MPLYQAFTLNDEVPLNSELPQAASVVSRWDLTEDGATRYDRKGTNHLTDTNTVASAAGLSNSAIFQRCAQFVAANSEGLTAADASWNSPTGAFTLAMWYQPKADDNGALFSKYEETGSQQSFHANRVAASNKINFAIYLAGSNKNVTSASDFNVDTWYHVIFVYEPSTRITIYVNGAEDAENSTTIHASISDTTAPFWLGRGNTVGQLNAIDAYMQDAIFWNTNLTDAEATTLYNLYVDTPGVSPSASLSPSSSISPSASRSPSASSSASRSPSASISASVSPSSSISPSSSASASTSPSSSQSPSSSNSLSRSPSASLSPSSSNSPSLSPSSSASSSVSPSSSASFSTSPSASVSASISPIVYDRVPLLNIGVDD